jgi:hypothetical protein
MHKSFLKSFVLAVVTALSLTLLPSASAQLVSAGLTGTVRGTDGNPIAGASVTALHTPTNATFTATSNQAGRFNFRGLPVGGPYTVTAKAGGYGEVSITDITAELGNDIDVGVTLKSEVLQLEKYVVGGTRNDLDSAASGAGSTLNSDRLAAKPTSERSLADMISASPLVTLRDTFGDREESQISAVGQNNRFNSIQIDGSRINDMFGLNATGLASFFNPLSLDTIEQLAVQISPYDVRQAGFTGASINAVTKSGTNKFRGSLYTYFRGNELFGWKLQGPNYNSLVTTGTKFTPRLERTTWGATLGGPILKDRLFFFLNYEKFESTIAGRDAIFTPANETEILTRLAAIATASGKTIDWGNAVTDQTANTSEDKKITAKLDWQINNHHRLSLRYTTTEGAVPQFGDFASTGTTAINGLTPGIRHSPDGHFYSQIREEKTVAGRFDSHWTQNFSTEVKYSTTTQGQVTPVNTIAPMILINGVTGIDLRSNTPIINGSYVAGTEQFRHGNVLSVDSSQLSITGDYRWRDFVFTGGYEREQTDFFNLFRAGSYGIIAYSSYANFLADTNAIITRNAIDPSIRNLADISSMATNGIFGQARWDYSNRLNFTFGLRYEFVESAIPPVNQAFVTATGFNNTGSLDGSSSISPRVGFNYALDEDRRTQVRGGIGHFFGRAPWVIFSNSWNSPGVGNFSLLSSGGQLPTSLTDYLRLHFDPANPIGIGTDNPALRREVDWVDAGTKLPQSWRGNLALEHKLPFLDSMLTLEGIHSKVDQAIFLTNENLRPTTIGVDGRQRFAGNPSTLANARFAGFTNLIRVQNTGVGESTYFTFQWSRPVKNKWGFDLAYTRGRSTDAQPIGQTTAGGQWFRNAVFNQNTVEEGTSDFEIRDRLQLSLTRQFEFIKDWRTTASLYYEGRSGNPHSWVFGGDLNGDGISGNDLALVPTGTSDSRFDFSGMTSTQLADWFSMQSRLGLSNYAGQIVPKNSFTEPWVNKLDLKLVQDIPLRFRDAKLQLFFDFINFGSFISKKTFGFTEVIGASGAVFRTRSFTSGTSYAADGRIRPLYTFTTDPFGASISDGMSRWRIQLGAKIIF